MSLAVATARLLLLCGAALTPLPCLAIPAEGEPSQVPRPERTSSPTPEKRTPLIAKSLRNACRLGAHMRHYNL
jgi:hypothetical protein